MSQRPPEHIEREMFEIRTRLDPGMNDLKKHLQPSVIAEQAKQTARARVQALVNRAKSKLQDERREIQDSAVFQYSLARKAGQEKDTAPLTDAVRNDPRPLVLLSVALTLILVVMLPLARRAKD